VGAIVKVAAMTNPSAEVVTSRRWMRLAAALIAAILACPIPAANARDPQFVSPDSAFAQGLGAYKGGYYEIAVPALEHAIAEADQMSRFYASYYLGRIYADNTGTRTDHPKAYILFQRLADDNMHIEPDDKQRAPYVADAFKQVASYFLTGLPEMGLKPDIEQAIDHLKYAATFFNDKDAQVELAKIYLRGEAPYANVKNGLHLLGSLAQARHPKAQALLAELHAQGKFVPLDQQRALALITDAVTNAPPAERIWIEDLYQTIFCGTSPSVRSQANGLVAFWERMLSARPPRPQARETGKMALGGDPLATVERRCANGEIIDLKSLRDAAAAPARQPLAGPQPGLRDITDTSTATPSR
jgi:hypothetical protein